MIRDPQASPEVRSFSPRCAVHGRKSLLGSSARYRADWKPVSTAATTGIINENNEGLVADCRRV